MKSTATSLTRSNDGRTPITDGPFTPFITFILKSMVFLQSDWLKIVRLIPKSHHFECDYKLIALPPKIQSNERTELTQPISFKFRNTKNIKLNFFKTGSLPKSSFLYKIAEFKFVFKYSRYPNKQTKMTDNKILKNINKILQN